MTGKTTSKSSNGRVRNVAVLKRGAPTPNTSAFKTPARPPAKLESMTARAKKELVARLIRRPEPAPTPTVAQAIKALEPPVRRFHGTKVPLSWFPRELVDPNHAGTFGYMFSASVRNATKLPSLPGYFPKQQATRNSEKFIAGPAGLARVGSPVPASMVDFASGAEVALKRYSTSAGEASLILIEYPTPQMAAERLRQIDATHQQTTQQTGTPTLVDSGPFFDKRTGPIIAIVVGALSQSEAKSLLASVNYEADVTWNENTSFTKKDNLANLLVNIILLCGILVGLALVAGVAFGGLRIILQRFAPGTAFGSSDEAQFISLHLEEAGSESKPRR